MERMFKGDGPLALAEQAVEAEERRKAVHDEFPKSPEFWNALPPATHRIEGGRPVCDGDGSSQCHWYPDCDDHESWPCGCEYVEHAECWLMPWLTSVDLDENAMDEAFDHRDPDTLEFLDGEIRCEWEVDYVLWTYVEEAEA